MKPPTEPEPEDPPTPESPLTPISQLPPQLTPTQTPSLRDRDHNWGDIDSINLIPVRTRSQNRIVDTPSAEQVSSLDIEGEFGTKDFEVALAAHTSLTEGMDPQSLKEVYSRADKLLWDEAMKDEIQQLEQRETWKVVKKPPDANVVGSKWVFQLKKDANGEVLTHRARLVAQGNYQIEGVDVFDTFAPVARLVSIQTVLALSA
jgi:Reverse transcriptase (RNA-dependent DNA polymerase)